MDEQKTKILTIASHLLSYPNEAFLDELSEICEMIEAESFSDDIKGALTNAIAPLSEKSLRELKETFVDTFDLKKNLGLYLTAHELGDSPKRGAALIRLQKMINTAGFERVDDELADYIPMLLEFMAVASFPDEERLQNRLAAALQRILDYMVEDNPYIGIFSVLMTFVFEIPTTEEMKKLELDREEADLEPMPYPIMY
jgi:nitrate reductase molybdenum cofactor assembly chaperone NarJ/NarW